MEQLAERIVDVLDGLMRSFRGFIAADFRLQPQVTGHRVDYRDWHKSRARIVEVQNLFAAGRVPTGAKDIKLGFIHRLIPTILEEVQAIGVLHGRGCPVF